MWRPQEVAWLLLAGGSVGCETADFPSDPEDKLLDRRTNVFVLEIMGKLALDMGMQPRQLLMQRLYNKEVNIFTSTSVKEILKDRIVVVRNQKEEVLHGIDQVILALGVKPVENLSEVIKTKINPSVA